MLPFDGDNPRSVLVMDNAAIHHVEDTIDLLTAAATVTDLDGCFHQAG